jgi:PAS domain S-box-containing protein
MLQDIARHPTDSIFNSDERRMIADAGSQLLPHLDDLAVKWTDALPINLPEGEAEFARRAIAEINLRLLQGLFTALSKGNLAGAYDFYEDFHEQLIRYQLDYPEDRQISLDQYYDSARVAIPLLERTIDDLLEPDEVQRTKIQLSFQRFWNCTLQCVGRIYSRLREAHFEKLRHTLASSEQRLRVLYEDATRAERARRESEQRFAHFMSNLPGVAFIKDREGKYVFVNETLSQVSGIPLDGWLGKTDPEVWPVAGAAQAVDSDREILETGKPLQLTEQIPFPDGLHYWLVTKFPILDDHGAVSMIGGISLDVTVQKRAEQELVKARDAALESARLKSAFLANMSHEIRTPLNIILGYNSLIAEHLSEQGDHSQTPMVDAIGRAGRRLMETIHRILDLSKIETGGFEIRPEQIDLRDLIEGRLQELEILAQEKGLRLYSQFETRATTVLFDEYCLSQALTNLLQNAIKFTEKGEVCARLFSNGGHESWLEVCDTGVGIDERYLPRLFEPFSQEQSGYTRAYEGSGLGLTLVRRYVELNGAKLEVESKKNVGSIFRIRFARSIPEQASAHP